MRPSSIDRAVSPQIKYSSAREANAQSKLGLVTRGSGPLEGEVGVAGVIGAGVGPEVGDADGSGVDIDVEFGSGDDGAGVRGGAVATAGFERADGAEAGVRGCVATASGLPWRTPVACHGNIQIIPATSAPATINRLVVARSRSRSAPSPARAVGGLLGVGSPMPPCGEMGRPDMASTPCSHRRNRPGRIM